MLYDSSVAVAVIFGAILPVLFTVAVATSIALGWHRPANMLWQFLMALQVYSHLFLFRLSVPKAESGILLWLLEASQLRVMPLVDWRWLYPTFGTKVPNDFPYRHAQLPQLLAPCLFIAIVMTVVAAVVVVLRRISHPRLRVYFDRYSRCYVA